MTQETITAEASRIVDAPIETVYDIIADYRVGHPAILPKQFTDLNVIQGGYGAGTEIKFVAQVYGQKTHYHQIVSEPEPGRVIREDNQVNAQYSEFRLEPLAENTQTLVTIFSEMPLSGGIKGVFERWFQPGIVRNIFQQELDNLAAYATSK